MEKTEFLPNVQTEEKKENAAPVQSGAVNADMNAAAQQTQMDKFQAAQGHGYAAEQANNLYDILTGKDAKIVGGDNAKDGPDRMVNGVNIQTKYCHDAASSVQAAFENGQYRYVNADGSPMQLEVPADQYEKAVELMAKRIERGEVPGVTDPEQAKEIVRKGKFTYQQAVNITKFGTIESIAFDAVNGAIICTSAFGITTLLTFAQHCWQGDPMDVAVEEAAYSGLQVGGAAFANSVITAQLMRTDLPKLLQGPTDVIVDLLGPKVSAILANALRDGANIYGAAAMKSLSKLLRCNFVASTVMTFVLSASDIRNAFRGQISVKQLIKNIITVGGGIAGGIVGAAAAGQAILGLATGGASTLVSGAVAAVGGMAGGMAGSSGAHALVGQFVEDDAVEMTRLIEDAFCQQAQDYLLNQDELEIALDELNLKLTGEKLLDMYASPDHEAYAEQFVKEIVERTVQGRCRIYMLTEAQMIQGIGRVVKDAEHGTGIFQEKSGQRPDPVAVGRALTGKEYAQRSARKGFYAARQMNTAQTQAENRLRKMADDERQYQQKITSIRQERAGMKNELAELMGGIES